MLLGSIRTYPSLKSIYVHNRISSVGMLMKDIGTEKSIFLSNIVNTVWRWGMEIRTSVKSHHQLRLKHILKGKGCRETQKSQQKSQLGSTGPGEITWGISGMRIVLVSLRRHLARDIISQVPDFWRSSDPLNLGFFPTGRLAVFIRHRLSLPSWTPQP